MVSVGGYLRLKYIQLSVRAGDLLPHKVIHSVSTTGMQAVMDVYEQKQSCRKSSSQFFVQ